MAVLPLNPEIYAELNKKGGNAPVCLLRGTYCSWLQSGKILFRMSDADHPQANRRAHEETAFPCYTLEIERALQHKASRVRSWIITFAYRMAFYLSAEAYMSMFLSSVFPFRLLNYVNATFLEYDSSQKKIRHCDG